MPDATNYWLSRLLLQRGLGLVYLLAFVCALNQFRPLLGERGLLPVPAFIQQVTFRESPSLFFFCAKDWAFAGAAWVGIVLSATVVLGAVDRCNSWVGVVIWAMLWALYISFVNVGQIFYGFGWESLLLEAGFFAMFLGGRDVAPQFVNVLIYRWLAFRIMFGAGLIKMRADQCWHNLTCLDYHYQSQPIPNPLSWYLHWSPQWTHRGGVLFNHFSEVVVPFAYFLPQPFSSIAGIITIAFQGMIMVSGNLSWLNFLTIILALPTLDDRLLGLLLPLRAPLVATTGAGYKAVTAAVGLLVAMLSINPIRNMLSRQQIMNTSFNSLHLVGTYGAFGSITKERYEVVVEGTADDPHAASATWREYEFWGKPGALARSPIQIAPYHLRLDWLMWFAAMSSYREHPWFVHFAAKLLEGDVATLSLLRQNPFTDKPPRAVRAEIYLYEFTTPDERRASGNWWKRRRAGLYLPPVSLEDDAFRQALHSQGWE